MGCTTSKGSEVMSRSATTNRRIGDGTSTSNATTKNISSIPEEVTDIMNLNNNPTDIIVSDKIEEVAGKIVTESLTNLINSNEGLDQSNEVPADKESNDKNEFQCNTSQEPEEKEVEEKKEQVIIPESAAAAVPESHAPDHSEGEHETEMMDPNESGTSGDQVEAAETAELLQTPSSERPATPEPEPESGIGVERPADETDRIREVVKVDVYQVHAPSTAGSIRGSEPDHEALAEVAEQNEEEEADEEQAADAVASVGENEAKVINEKPDEEKDEPESTDMKVSTGADDAGVNSSSANSSTVSVNGGKSVKSATAAAGAGGALVNGNHSGTNSASSNHHPHHLRKLSSSVSLPGSNGTATGKGKRNSGSSSNNKKSASSEANGKSYSRKSSSASIHKDALNSH